MKNLTLPEINDLALWETIVTKKHHNIRDPLLLLKPVVAERYTYYAASSNQLDQIAPSNSPELDRERENLIGCYGNNVTLVPIKKSLLSLSHKCPYCCINRPDTLDHYFDKSHYPEYSVFTPNLVPCCSHCNRIKGTQLFDEYNHRSFIHYYFDSIPEYQFVFVRFTFKNGCDNRIPLISVFLQFRDENQKTAIVQRHFKKLDLLSQYKEAVKDKLPYILSELQGYRNILDFDTLKSVLRNKYDSLLEHKGCNYWETCMYEGILNSPNFLERYNQVES